MSLPFPLSFDGVESVVELVLTGVIGRSAAALRPIGFSSSSGETSPRSTGVEDVTDGDEADVSLDEGMESCSPISTDFRRLELQTDHPDAVPDSRPSLHPDLLTLIPLRNRRGESVRKQ